MSARVLLEIALRVFGIWYVFLAVNSLLSSASLVVGSLLSIPGTNLGNPFIAGGFFVVFLVQLLLGGALIYGAPAIAVRFYPPGGESETPRVSVGPGDVYRTACFVLGAYLLVQATEAAGRIVIFELSEYGTRDQVAAYSIKAMVSLASGLVLVFGSRKITEMLASLRYDPETIPQQKFSIAILLAVLAFVAVVLGVTRMIVVGG
jgi:hypothetical protein